NPSSDRPLMPVAYLLADPGVPYFDSRKGSSIHARSMVRAFQQEGCQVEVLAMRCGARTEEISHVTEAAPSWKTRAWRRAVMKGGLWRVTAPRAARRPNWVEAVHW